MKREKILFFSNLYPLPWDPTRAAYNKQIVESLSPYADVDILVPVPFQIFIKQWLKGNCRQPGEENLSFFPFFYIPGFARATYAFTLLLSICLCVFPLVKILRAQRIISSWAYPDSVTISFFKKWGRFKHVIYCLGSDINYHFDYPARRKQMLRAFRRADCVVTVSEDLNQQIAKYALPGTRIKTIYNGVNFDEFTLSSPTKTPYKVLFVGSLIKTKGIFELLGAMAELKRRGLAVHLGIIGQGSEASEIEKRLAKLNLLENVTCYGAIPHSTIPAYLNDYHALALPSYREGVPNVIMEALASGIPPIATKVGGIPEIICHGENGVLIEKNSDVGVADAIEFALKHDWTPASLRASIEQYTWPNCAKEIMQEIN